MKYELYVRHQYFIEFIQILSTRSIFFLSFSPLHISLIRFHLFLSLYSPSTIFFYAVRHRSTALYQWRPFSWLHISFYNICSVFFDEIFAFCSLQFVCLAPFSWHEPFASGWVFVMFVPDKLLLLVKMPTMPNISIADSKVL